MSSTKYKTILCLFIGIFFLNGCGKTVSTDAGGLQDAPSGSHHTNEIAENSSSDHNAFSWQARYYPLADQYDYVLAADRLYGCALREDQVSIDIYDINDLMGKQELSAGQTLTIPDASSVMGMASDGEGNVYLMGNKGESIGLWRIDTEGTLQEYTEIEPENTEGISDLSLKGIYTDRDGTFYIWCGLLAEDKESQSWHWEDRVYVKDGQLNTLFTEKIADMGGTEVLSFQVGTDGRPLFIVKDPDGVYMQEIDAAQKERKDAIRLEKAEELFDDEYVNSMENIAPLDDGFLYCRNNELFLFDVTAQKTEKLLSLSTYGIFSSDILFLKKEEAGIEIIDNHEASGNPEFISFTLGENEKRIVTLGSTLMLPYLEKVVAEFNRYNSEYRIEIIDYVTQEGDSEAAVEQLKLDIISGKAPDIITVGGMDHGIFSQKGVLADLYEFMKDDEECNKEMLVQSVAEAYEYQGHLYRISPSFQLHSMWGYSDVTGGQSGVTFEELFQMLENSGKDLNSIAGFSADEPVLSRLCMVSMDEFIDWENGTCSFDGDYFKKVLSFAKEYTGNYTGGAYSERIQNREVVMSVGIISSVTDYQLQNELYGGSAAFVGYPVQKGSGTAVAFRADAVAINARKEDQRGAWEFVKFYLLHGYDGQGFPIIREQFDQALDAAMVENYNVSEDGHTERFCKEYYCDGGKDIYIYAATQEDVDAVRRLVESAGTRCEWNLAIQNIISEEAAGYFSGQVDIDDTVKKIQNRVQLYLDERM
ncbi:MAG: extracellular solute-binding protein [Firmicutes bacterium]|nr:extracellular solute-binding protein [Bacillota bacterium]